jgi:hypothetical protein
VALIAQSGTVSSTAKVAHEARQLAMPVVAIGVVIAVLYSAACSSSPPS